MAKAKRCRGTRGKWECPLNLDIVKSRTGRIAGTLREIPSAACYKPELEAMGKENAILKSQVSDLSQ